jgi:hypothetical protein
MDLNDVFSLTPHGSKIPILATIKICQSLKMTTMAAIQELVATIMITVYSDGYQNGNQKDRSCSCTQFSMI